MKDKVRKKRAPWVINRCTFPQRFPI